MRVTLKFKLGAIFATVLALSGVGMYIAIDKLSALKEQFQMSLEGNVARIQQVDDINARTLRVARDEKNHILESDNAGWMFLRRSSRRNFWQSSRTRRSCIRLQTPRARREWRPSRRRGTDFW